MNKTRRAAWRGWVGLSLLSLLWCLPAPAQTKPKTAKPPAATPAGAETEEPTVKGVEAKRDGKGFLGLAVEGNAFVLRFYDADKAEIPADAVRALARWDSPVKLGKQRTVLNPEGTALKSPPVVRPPLAFSVFVTLINAAGDVMETKSFNLRTL